MKVLRGARVIYERRFSLTPTPPPFSLIKITPALDSAVKISSIVSDRGLASSSSMLASVLSETPDSSASCSLDNPRSERAARICAAFRVACFMQLVVDSLRVIIAQFVHPVQTGNHTKEVANMATKSVESRSVTIPAPKFGFAEFEIKGTAPLVIHRFSRKTQNEMKQKMETGKAASSKKNREAKSTDDIFNEARYRHSDGWDGFNAASIRNAMISACRLVNFKMTLAKLSIFVEADGWDKDEPQIPLVKIIGKPVKQEDMARVTTGQPYVTVRPAYHDWRAKVRIRWDEDQFTLADVSNLLSRVGQQVGIGEGRPDSKNSAGMGWGLFELAETKTARKAA